MMQRPNLRADVMDLVLAAIDEINQQLPPDRGVPRSEEAPLTGPASALDSLAFLSLIVTAEERIAAAYRRPINLAATLLELNDDQSPRTVGELASLIVSRLD